MQDVFVIKGRGLVATGTVESGSISVGDEVDAGGRHFTVTGVEMFRKKLDTASAGETVGLLLRDATRDDIARGAVLGSQFGGRATGAEDLGLT